MNDMISDFYSTFDPQFYEEDLEIKKFNLMLLGVYALGYYASEFRHQVKEDAKKENVENG